MERSYPRLKKCSPKKEPERYRQEHRGSYQHLHGVVPGKRSEPFHPPSRSNSRTNACAVNLCYSCFFFKSDILLSNNLNPGFLNCSPWVTIIDSHRKVRKKRLKNELGNFFPDSDYTALAYMVSAAFKMSVPIERQ